jgi:hypothetical protein
LRGANISILEDMNMAYDRHDTRHPRDDRSNWHDQRSENRDWHRDNERGGRGEGGFFERAGEQISSWFGGHDDDHDHHRDREFRDRQGYGREPRQERESFFGGRGRNNDRDDRHQQGNRGVFGRGGSSDRDYNPGREPWGGGDRGDDRGGGYQPMTGDYGRGSNVGQNRQFFAASGMPSGGFDRDDHRDRQRSETPRDRDDYRRTSYAGSSADFQRRPQEQDRHAHDPHYAEWRRRHMEELDSHYDEYRREHQGKFENDFGSWREQRQTKRQMLGQVREHMHVVGNDGQPVGTVDRVAGDRVILTKSDPQANGAHHSIGCTEIDRIEGEQVLLGCSAEQAMKRWRDEDRGRALFEREDQGSSGPHILDRSFEGTYR